MTYYDTPFPFQRANQEHLIVNHRDVDDGELSCNVSHVTINIGEQWAGKEGKRTVVRISTTAHHSNTLLSLRSTWNIPFVKCLHSKAWIILAPFRQLLLMRTRHQTGLRAGDLVDSQDDDQSGVTSCTGLEYGLANRTITFITINTQISLYPKYQLLSSPQSPGRLSG